MEIKLAFCQKSNKYLNTKLCSSLDVPVVYFAIFWLICYYSGYFPLDLFFLSKKGNLSKVSDMNTLVDS